MIVREKGIQTLSKKLFDGKGEALIEPLFMPDEFESAVRFCARVTLESGCSIGLHQHIAEDELYFIIEGAGEAADEDGKYTVSAGHSILTSTLSGNNCRILLALQSPSCVTGSIT